MTGGTNKYWKLFDHLFRAPLLLQAQLLHHRPSSFSENVFLCLFNISSLGHLLQPKYTTKEAKIRFTKVGKCSCHGQVVYTDCIYRGGGGRDDISIFTRIPFTTQVPREHLLLKILSPRPATKGKVRKHRNSAKLP